MNWILDGVVGLSAWLKPLSGHIALAFVATLLVIYGGAINRALRGFVKSYPFILRVAAFMLLCTLGYGLVVVWGAAQLKLVLIQIPNVWFSPLVILSFILIGVLAERYHKS